jgi:hypothetical protein
MKKRNQQKRSKEKKAGSAATSPTNSQPKLDKETLKQIETGRRIMKEYREVFEKLAKM